MSPQEKESRNCGEARTPFLCFKRFFCIIIGVEINNIFGGIIMQKKRKLYISVVFLVIIFTFLIYLINKPVGYRWKCLNGEHYVSKVHLFSDTAITKANAHAAQYGHQVTIVKVKR